MIVSIRYDIKHHPPCRTKPGRDLNDRGQQLGNSPRLGVEFIDENVGGPRVRLRKPSHQHAKRALDRESRPTHTQPADNGARETIPTRLARGGEVHAPLRRIDLLAQFAVPAFNHPRKGLRDECR